ncbi:hypothetical protein [Leptothrix cholodnii]|uniref:hypothetical protein n=1 Tax=Leptothrix cholodnii TaxID=34029 RepID=UPI0012370C3F|nr:hypothetical protein [Leptothrix cholodnii]
MDKRQGGPARICAVLPRTIAKHFREWNFFSMLVFHGTNVFMNAAPGSLKTPLAPASRHDQI